MRTIRYEVKDSTRNYWWITAREGERQVPNPKFPELFMTEWRFHVSFEFRSEKSGIFSDSIMGQDDIVPTPEDFMWAYQSRVTGALVAAAAGNIITRDVSDAKES